MSRDFLVNVENERFDYPDANPTRRCVSTTGMAAWYDYVWVFVSVSFYVGDVVTDMLVSVKYYRSGDYIWFSLTVLCVVGASLVMMAFSLKWFYDDTANQVDKTVTVVLHLLQLGPLKRYWDCYMVGKRSREENADDKYYGIYIEQWRDIALLRLFEVFIESAPQLVLQLYILAYNRHFDKENDWLTACSACFSLVSLSTSIVSYSKALRDASPDKGKMTWWAFGCQIVWRLSMVASRIVTLVLFASVYKSWILFVIGLHWVGMTLWIYVSMQKKCDDDNTTRDDGNITRDDGNIIRDDGNTARDDGNTTRDDDTIYQGNKVLKFIFPIVMGFIYVFIFFNVKPGFTRKRLVFFYTLMFVENCALMVAWLPYRHEYGVVFVAALGMVFGGFFLGVIMLFLYYQCYHPSLPMQGICIRTTHDVPPVENIRYRMICCDTCCHVRERADEESSPPRGRSLDVDISRNSLQRDLAHNRSLNTSPTFESEILVHRPSTLQRQYSLDKEEIKKKKAERARHRNLMGSAAQNGAANTFAVSLDDAVINNNGAISQQSPREQIVVNQNNEVISGNRMAPSVDTHASRAFRLSNGHGSVANFSQGSNSHISFQEDSRGVAGHAPTNVLPETLNVDLNYNGSSRTPCDDAVHCGTDYEKDTRASCDDGVHCGTDDEKEKGIPFDNGVRCVTDDEKETKTLCNDELHCSTTDEKKTGSPCDDGIHCGTDDEKETPCDGWVHSGTDCEKKDTMS